MRVTEGRMLDVAAAAVADARGRAAQAGATMQSGVRVARPSDDVAAWTQGERTAVRQQLSGDRGKALGLARDSLAQSDGAFAAITNSLSKLTEIAVQGANGILGPDERANLAGEVRQLRDASLAAGNQKGPDGGYLFAGTQGGVAPFTAAGVYQGDGIARNVESAEGALAPGSVTGALLTSSSGLDVFAVFNTVEAALSTNNPAALQAALPSVQQAVAQVASARSQIGTRMNALDQAQDARQSFETTLAATHGRAVEADPVVAASDLAHASTALESARAVAQQIMSILHGG